VRIAIDRLLSEGFALELPRDAGEPDRLELERGVGVRGVYASDRETIVLDGVRADELDAARVTWFIGETTKVLAAPLVLGGAELDARIARGVLHGRQRFVGRFGSRELSARAVGLDVGATRLAAAALEGAGVSYQSAQGEPAEVRAARLALQALAVGTERVRVELEGAECRGAALRVGAGLEVAVATLELRGGRAKLGELEISFAAAAAGDVRLSKNERGWEVGCRSLSLRGLELRTASARVVVSRLEITEGLRYEAGGFTLGAAEIDELEAELTLVEPAPESGPKPRRAPFDLRFLDALSGRVLVDLGVDVKLPIIRRRVATHAFRIPIEGGKIDFHELERDLAFLEDAVLDFKLKGDRLVFQKDIPLVPFDEETIVYWSLDDEEIALAKRNLVRLRRLFDVKQPERKDPRESKVELVQLDLDPIEAVLRLEGASEIVHRSLVVRLGGAEKDALGELRVAGAVRHRPDQPAQPGELRVDAREIRVGVEGLSVGGRTVAVQGAEIDAVSEVRVVFSGLRPTAVRGALRGVRTRGVRST
jgi:hypothetical protein